MTEPSSTSEIFGPHLSVPLYAVIDLLTRPTKFDLFFCLSVDLLL